MAQAAGFTCDVCSSFAMAVKNSSSAEKPFGWMSVHVVTSKGERESIDVCSNYCLAMLGKLRWECESDNEGKRFLFRGTEKRPRKAMTPEQREAHNARLRLARAAKKAKAESNG